MLWSGRNINYACSRTPPQHNHDTPLYVRTDVTDPLVHGPPYTHCSIPPKRSEADSEARASPGVGCCRVLHVGQTQSVKV